MRAVFIILVILMASAAIACNIAKEEEPIPDLESTVAARLEATRQVERAVNATVETQAAVQASVKATTEAMARDGTPVSPAVPPASAPAEDCDELLRNQLVFQKDTHTSARMNEVTRQIQAQRDQCAPEYWNPVAVDPVPEGEGTCLSWLDGIDPVHLPPGLLTLNGEDPKPTSGRDSYNNVIVYWSKNTNQRPHQGSRCWIYLADLNAWMTGEDLQGNDAKIRRLNLKEGDCIVFEEGHGEFDATPRKVPCKGEWTHRMLRFFEVEAKGSYPGENYFQEQALRNCGPNYTLIIYPLKEGWKLGDRKVTCLQESFGLSVTDPGKLDRLVTAESLKEGNCINFAPETGGSQVELVDCSGTWEMRLLNRFIVSGYGVYPRENEFDRQTVEHCDRRRTYWLYPDQDAWSGGDRTVECLQENLTGERGISSILDRLIDPFLLNLNECFNPYENPDLFLVELTTCSGEWEFQVIRTVRIPGNGTYPGDQQIEDKSFEICGAEAEYILHPEEIHWELGYRNTVCLRTGPGHIETTTPPPAGNGD